MDIKEYPKLKDFVIRHQEETLLLLKELAAIGAPTFQEDQRAIFCLEWLKRQGAENAYIDEAGNVIFPFVFVSSYYHKPIDFTSRKPVRDSFSHRAKFRLKLNIRISQFPHFVI